MFSELTPLKMATRTFSVGRFCVPLCQLHSQDGSDEAHIDLFCLA
jgi:hypothetical protein